MARYEWDFQGTRGGFGPVRGMDPNYRDGYRGMAFHAGEGQAPYGAWRWRHQQDLGGFGGFRGSYDRDLRAGSHREHLAGYDRGYEASGGVREWRNNRELVRHFNAASTELRRPRGSYDVDGPRRPGHLDRGPGDAFRYGNRGMSRGGFSEPWGVGPRGAR